MHFAAYCDFAGSFAQAIQPATLAQWRQHLYETGYTLNSGERKDYSVNAINQRLAAIRGVMTEAAQQGYITHQVADEFKHVKGLKQVANKDRRSRHARTPITSEQMRKLCDQPDTSTLAGKMNRALLLTLAGVGCRITEAVEMTTGQIRWDTNDETGRSGWVVDIAGKNKADAEPRAMSNEAHAAIQEWLQARREAGVDTEHIFTGFTGRGDRGMSDKPISRVSAWEMVGRYAEKAGLSNIKPHDLRRFVGTQLAKKDLRLAQKQLGHARLETTAQHYVLDGAPVGATEGLF
ncbi:MAG: site-specific integrase [Caldilineaceae bacterium]